MLFLSRSPYPPQLIGQWLAFLGSPEELLNISDAKLHSSPIKSEPLGVGPKHPCFLKDPLVVLVCSEGWEPRISRIHSIGQSLL